MERKKPSLLVQIELTVEAAQKRDDLTNKPLWELVQDGIGIAPPPNSQESPACPVKSTSISHSPDNMIEGLQRLEALEGWIEGGRTPEEFYIQFGSPKGGGATSGF